MHTLHGFGTSEQRTPKRKISLIAHPMGVVIESDIIEHPKSVLLIEKYDLGAETWQLTINSWRESD